MIKFVLSKSIACETKDFQMVFGNVLKCFKKAVHKMDDYFVELRLF